MAKTRRDLLMALREKILAAAEGNPVLVEKIKGYLDKAALDVLGDLLDREMTDAEFEWQLAQFETMREKTPLFDSRVFPPADKATIAGLN